MLQISGNRSNLINAQKNIHISILHFIIVLLGILRDFVIRNKSPPSCH